MNNYRILLALAIFSVAGESSAQDTTFRGIRVEGQAGGDRFQSQGEHDDRFGYGGAIGFDGTFGDRLVVGAEGTLWNGRGENVTASRTGGMISHKSFEEVGVAARLGFLASPQLMVYGKGGYVSNEQRKRFSGTGAANGGAFYDHFRTDGYQVGGGVEYSLNRNFYLDGEYKYSNFHDHTSRQRVLGGVGFRFK